LIFILCKFLNIPLSSTLPSNKVKVCQTLIKSFGTDRSSLFSYHAKNVGGLKPFKWDQNETPCQDPVRQQYSNI